MQPGLQVAGMTMFDTQSNSMPPDHFQVKLQELDISAANLTLFDMQVEALSADQLRTELMERGVQVAGMTVFDMQDALWEAFQQEAGLLPAEDLDELQEEIAVRLQICGNSACTPVAVMITAEDLDELQEKNCFTNTNIWQSTHRKG